MVLSDSDKSEIRKMVEKALEDRVDRVERDVAGIEHEIYDIKKRLDELAVLGR